MDFASQERETPAPSPSVEVVAAPKSQALVTLPSFAITPQRAVILALLAAGAYKRKTIMASRKHALSFAALIGLLVWNERRGASEGYCSKCGH